MLAEQVDTKQGLPLCLSFSMIGRFMCFWEGWEVEVEIGNRRKAKKATQQQPDFTLELTGQTKMIEQEQSLKFTNQS